MVAVKPESSSLSAHLAALRLFTLNFSRVGQLDKVVIDYWLLLV